MASGNSEKQSSVLAIDAAPSDAAASWRARGASLIDALPYVDSLTPSERALADRLIEAELASSTKTPEDYLAELPPARDLDPSKLGPLVRAELSRVARGEEMPPLDASRYRLDAPPPDRRGDAVAWRACLDNARAQLEHQGNRVVNLELGLRFGARAAEAAASAAAASAAMLEREATAALARVAATNRRRKLEQERAAQEAADHEARWVEGVRKCAEIEEACAALEGEVAALAAEAAEKRGGAVAVAAAVRKENGSSVIRALAGDRSHDELGLPPLPGEEGGGDKEQEATTMATSG